MQIGTPSLGFIDLQRQVATQPTSPCSEAHGAGEDEVPLAGSAEPLLRAKHIKQRSGSVILPDEGCSNMNVAETAVTENASPKSSSHIAIRRLPSIAKVKLTRISNCNGMSTTSRSSEKNDEMKSLAAEKPPVQAPVDPTMFGSEFTFWKVANIPSARSAAALATAALKEVQDAWPTKAHKSGVDE